MASKSDGKENEDPAQDTEKRGRQKPSKRIPFVGAPLAKLPNRRPGTNREFLLRLLHLQSQHPKGTTVKFLASNVISEAVSLSNCPSRRNQDCIRTLIQLHEKYVKLRKNESRSRKSDVKKRATFLKSLDTLFDLEQSLKKNRASGDGLPVDDEVEVEIIHDNFLALDDQDGFTSSQTTSEDSDWLPSDLDQEAPSNMIHLSLPKNFMSHEDMVSTLDRLEISDGKATQIVAALLRIGGVDPDSVILSHSSTKRSRHNSFSNFSLF